MYSNTVECHLYPPKKFDAFSYLYYNIIAYDDFTGKSKDIMIYSMTGFGRGESESDNAKIIIEIKSVNHRFLDTNFKMPSFCYSLEERMQKLLKTRISRGKVDVNLTVKSIRKSQKTYTYDPEAAAYFMNVKKEAIKEFGIKDNFGVYELFRMPGVIVEDTDLVDPEELWIYVKEAFEIALDKFVESRASEGERLRVDLAEKVSRIDELADALEERAPQIIEEYKDRLRQKVTDFIDESQVDENRLAEEVILYSDKICIDEEIVRLKSHVSEINETLEATEPIGRKMDFISQELNRESNTILSKSSDVYTADIGIELKTLIEKIREQVQNIE
jgi:uncharacterized protein (TIGR00255 family)